MLSKESIEERLRENIKIESEVHTLGEWLEKIGITYNGYLTRIDKGLTIDQALTIPRGKVYAHEIEMSLKSQEKEKPKAKKVEYKFVRNGGGAGTWKWVEVDA